MERITIERLRELNQQDPCHRRNGQVERAKAVLAQHPEAVLLVCADEKTGVRFGDRACRRGRAMKLGHTTYSYQLWASWAARDRTV